jgi:cytochrome c551/c552
MLGKILKIIVITVLVGIGIFLLIQLIPYGKDYINPPVVSEPNWDSQQTRVLAKRACFDCHSNETVWPWYSKIAPVSWLVYRDVIEGRRRLNFSDWQNSYLRDLGEIASVINEGEMPPFQYLPMHPSARLSTAEKTQLINGLEATLSR